MHPTWCDGCGVEIRAMAPFQRSIEPGGMSDLCQRCFEQWAGEYAAEEEEDGDMVTYGPFPGGDPRRFEPDSECCSSEEVQRWKEECAAWDRGEGQDRGPGCATIGDGSVWTGTGFGVGTYRWG